MIHSRIRRTITNAAALAAAFVVAAGTTTDVAGAQAATDRSNERGAPALGSLLASLGTTGRVLTIAAHPDDEDTQFIAWLARGRHVETAYLSLTRGDGGQNLIGNELGEALGIIRTQELMAARRIDGGRQYFTRAYDFGFSKNAEETYTQWPKDTILGDVVRVIRGFRPHVVVAFFSGTPRDGHGHHQVSGLLAREAYDAAGDTVRFPVLTHGQAWTPAKFYRSARQDTAKATLRMNVGEYNPLLGRSYYEIAAESRSQHKSQGFGVLQRKGAIIDHITREASRVNESTPATGETTLFDGVDTTWARLGARTNPLAAARLDSAMVAIREARALFRAEDPSPTVAPLARAARLLHAARNDARIREPMFAGTAFRRLPVMAASDGAAPAAPSAPVNAPPAGDPRSDELARNAELWDALSVTIDRTERALLQAAGIAVEATAPKAIIPVREATKREVNDSMPVAITVYNRGRSQVVLASARAQQQLERSTDEPVTILPDSALTVTRYAVARASTAPWWRREGRRGQAWFLTPIGFPDERENESRTALTARVSLMVEGAVLEVTTPIVNRYADPVKGDQQVQVAGVPGITINLERSMEYIRAGVPVTRDLFVYVQSAYPHPASVLVKLELPKGLSADSVEKTRVLTPDSSSSVIVFRLRGTIPPGRHQLAALAIHEASLSTSGYVTMAYDHITPQRLYGASGMYLSAVKVALPPRARVGYIPGVGDRGMDALKQLDIDVETIEPAAVATADLSRFSTVVVGPRAYEASPALARANPRLLNYARNGGHLVVQYGQYEMLAPGIMPYPIQLSRPAARVTLEDAPVKILRPDAPLLTTPNRLAPEDWADWVQERAIYMPTTAAPQYTPFVAMNDPNEPENRNAILQARVGRGSYTYVTLSLFRQLPNGVPGAAKILLNLVSGAAPGPRM